LWDGVHTLKYSTSNDRSAFKSSTIMHALFFDAKRPVAQIPVPERASVSG
jgi:hypothetical protein